MDIKENQKNKIIKHFKNISKIPRCSKHEEKISEYIANQCKNLGLEVYKDKYNNVLIKKAASKDYENKNTVILQGHLDMVCEKTIDSNHDFDNNGIDLIIGDKYISSNKTTLGADNGIALAYCLTILESKDIKHPNLEVLFTTEEEVGMRGATNFDYSKLSGRTMINLDSEEEGVFLAGCAGGVIAKVKYIGKKRRNSENFNSYKIIVKGLKGGHSGQEIHKNRANAIVLASRVFNELNKKLNIKLISINGGSKNNSIPVYSELEFSIDEELDKINSTMELINSNIKNEFKRHDSDLDLCIIENKRLNNYEIFDNKSCKELITMLLTLPDGIVSINSEDFHIVESSCNIGVVKTIDNKVEFELLVRSSIESKKSFVLDKIKKISDLVNAEVNTEGNYPGWQYEEESRIREVASREYEKIYDEKPIIATIHAGLECGIIKKKLNGLDVISIGPNLLDVHTVNERVEIDSLFRTWEFLISILES